MKGYVIFFAGIWQGRVSSKISPKGIGLIFYARHMDSTSFF